MPSFNETVFRKAMELLHKKGQLSPDMVDEKKIRLLIDEYVRIFHAGIDVEIKHGVESGVIPDTMRKKLDSDVFLFSGFKTYNELKEASMLLRDDDGQIKPFSRFYNDITAVKQDYNKNWLQSEYIFATQSAQMASKWKEQAEDGDRYNLQYRTAGDERVRYEHRLLNRITLPQSNPFWDEFYPPNGWRCRCTVVQVRKGKYAETDSNTAMTLGKQATFIAGKNGVNKAAIFRFNPGKQQVIFPPHHPYYANQCATCDRKNVKLSAKVTDNELCKVCIELRNNIIDQNKTKLELRESIKKLIDNLKTNYPNGTVIKIGRLPDEAIAFINNQKIKLNTEAIFISDHQIRHALRDSKKKKGKSVTEDDLANLPLLLETCDVYWDSLFNNIMLIEHNKGLNKYIIQLNYTLKIAGRKEIVNSFLTAGVINETVLKMKNMKRIR